MRRDMLPGYRQDPTALHRLSELDGPAVSASSAVGRLIQRLPRLASHDNGIDFPGSDPDALVAVAGAAEDVVQNAHHGLQSVGALMASVRGKEAQRQAVSALTGLGVLVAELSALASHCSALAADCRRETLDFDPDPVPEANDDD